jgi:hypothetical protein
MSNEGNVERTEILPLLGPVKKQGEWVMAYCPAHADGTKHNGKGGHSLGLSNEGVLRCFAGCTFADVMKALRERAPEIRKPVAGARSSGDGFTLKKAYEYRDHDGKVLAVKGRFERPNPDGGKPEKSFRWRLPESDYKDGLGGAKVADMPLWGADELGPIDQRVWFAEGEAATEAIRARNEIAVCGGWGASQREFGDAFEVLRGRDVILWPDNDPPGREYMAAVRRHLAGIARSVAVVTAPVPPKGDAVEYFQAGGTVEALLANVVVRPTVDVLSPDHFIVRIPTDSGPVAFDFASMTRSGGALDCELTVTHLSPASEPEPYSQRLNLLSQSARAGLERALGLQFGKDGVNWTTVVSTAYARARQTFFDMDRGMQLGSLPEVTRQTFLVDTLLPAGQPTIFFGDGSSGKTMITYALGLCVALGTDFCGLKVEQGGVLVVDYETSPEAMRFRFRRLMLGMGVDASLINDIPVHYWPGNGIPLPDHVEGLTRFIERHGINLVIIDSAGAACPGKPEDSVAALAYFNALNKLRVTSLTIAHVNRADAETSSYRPFGSTFWSNMARRTWFVKRDSEEESDEVDLGLMCRKVNDGPRPRNLSFRMSFSGSSGPVTFNPQAFREVAAFDSERPVRERVREFLVEFGQSTIAEIVEATGLANDSVKSVLYRGQDKEFTRIGAGTGRGNKVHWGVLAS